MKRPAPKSTSVITLTALVSRNSTAERCTTRAGGAPRSFLEQVAMEIWAEVLGVARIGRDAGFAELGGHSLAAMQAAARAQDRLGLEVSARSLFDATTLAGWAEHLAALQLAQTDPEILAAVLAELEASRGSTTH